MAKIFNVRLPNASAEYQPEQFDQLVRSLEQIILQLNTSYTSTPDQNQLGASSWLMSSPGAGGGFAGGVRGFQSSHGILLPYGLMMSDQDQTNASITGENLVTYNAPALMAGVRVIDNSKLKFSASGQYFISFSLQVTNRGNTAAEFEVWAKNTTVNYPLSNTRYDIPPRKASDKWSHTVASISGIFTVKDPAVEYLEIAWWSDSLDVFLENYAAGTSPTRPAIPSVILAAAFVSSTGGNLG